MTAGRALVAVAVVVAALGAARPARADDLTVGVFVPSAPFASTSARQDYATRLATHLAAATGDAGVGRVYARAADLAAALKKGELDVAVVDAAYLATRGAGVQVIATATRGGDVAAAWQLVSIGGEDGVLALEGKRVQVAAIGGGEADFVHHALFGGELARSFFAGIDTSPDVASVLAALKLGKASVAIVPGGVELPSGARRVAALPEVSWPVLVAASGLDAARTAKVTEAAGAFAGGDVLTGFRAGGADAVRALGRRFGKVERRGPMAIPRIDVAVDALVEGRKPVIRRRPVRTLVVAPPPLPPVRR